MGLLDLVEEHHGERLAADLLGQLAALLVPHVPRRGTEEPGDGVLLLVLGHVQRDQGVLVTEQELRERLGQLGLTHTGGPGEDERATRTARVLQTSSGTADGAGQGLDGLVLPDDALVQLVLHVQQPPGLLLGELVHGHTRGGGQDVRDDLRGHLRDLVVALAPRGVLLVTLGDELLLGVAQGRGLLVVLALDRGFLDTLGVRDLLVQGLDLRRRGHALDAQTCTGLVDQVDGLVGQEPVRDVARGHVHRGLQRVVRDGHAVVRLVFVAQALEDLHGVGLGGLVHLDGLEAPFEGGVLLDVLAVLVQRGGTDGLQLTARQHGLEDRRGVDRAFRGTRTHERVDLVDEQDDVPARTDLLEHLLEAFLEVTAVTGTGHERSQVQRVELLVLKRLGDVPAHDRLGQALHDCGLTDTGFTDQHRVVLGAPGEHLHHALHLAVAPDHGVQRGLARGGGEVATELVQHGRTRGSALGAATGADTGGFLLPAGVAGLVTGDQFQHRGADLAGIGAELDEHLGGHALAGADDPEQDVLGPDVVVPQLQGLAQRVLEHLLGAGRERDVTRGRLLARADDVLDLLAGGAQGDAHGLEGFGGDALTLVDQAEQQVLGPDVVVVEHPGLFLGQHDDPAGAVGEAFEHGYSFIDLCQRC